MSKSFLELRTTLAEALKDPDSLTFTDAMLADLVNIGISNVGRIIPQMFQEDIDPVADTLSYVLMTNEFGGDAVPEIEVARVELWRTVDTPAVRWRLIKPASAGQIADSQVGWSNWGGTLYLPNWVAGLVRGAESDYLIRVWGYAPYPQLIDDDDVFSGSTEAVWAVIQRAEYEALKRLVNDRNLFTQWQTRSGNSDTTLAGLMNERSIAGDEWRRTERALYRLRSQV